METLTANAVAGANALQQEMLAKTNEAHNALTLRAGEAAAGLAMSAMGIPPQANLLMNPTVRREAEDILFGGATGGTAKPTHGTNEGAEQSGPATAADFLDAVETVGAVNDLGELLAKKQLGSVAGVNVVQRPNA